MSHQDNMARILAALDAGRRRDTEDREAGHPESIDRLWIRQAIVHTRDDAAGIFITLTFLLEEQQKMLEEQQKTNAILRHVRVILLAIASLGIVYLAVR
jgi:hypothetical protein